MAGEKSVFSLHQSDVKSFRADGRDAAGAMGRSNA
jgi:hypothetical protein